ncbi:prepilin peptidase [Myxacorys almedinensis]|uniref:Prepilin leader peptidase/N-methyltransferase n=1 Tax=Myxacorys almedinensis A TaxID=2690445 RepID=A0A8J7YYV2_9CYAN|nr:A24 family peptidase [Myxacorys almedinensis]NDJ15895.1 prepilin peptidase [Myxacorys almedinensis A]
MEFFLVLPACFIVFALGASIGSFLNVVVYRLPAKLSILYPPSRCPHCLTRLKKHHNVPVLGWLWLNGKCNHCKSPISKRYPLVEASTGLIFLLVFLTFGLSVQTIGYWAFLSWLVALSIIDLDTMTLPESLTRSGLVVGLGFQLFSGWTVSGFTGAIQNLMMGAIAAVLGIWLLDIIAIVGSVVFGQQAMGAGDSKLMAMIGAWLGWKSLLLAGFLACASGALVGGGAIALGILSRRQPMPFGPFLALGAAIALFYGERLISSYLSLFPT